MNKSKLNNDKLRLEDSKYMIYTFVLQPILNYLKRAEHRRFSEDKSQKSQKANKTKIAMKEPRNQGKNKNIYKKSAKRAKIQKKKQEYIQTEH